MRKAYPILGAALVALVLSGCGQRGFDRSRPDEFAVARQAPLVVPPDYALVPPQTGVARSTEGTAQAEALQALFGGPAPRSASERSALGAAGAAGAAGGIRSGVGDPDTNVVDKGTTTRDIVAAPEGDGAASRVVTP